MGNQVGKVPQTVEQSAGTNDVGIGQQPVGQIPWGHNILLMEKVKNLPTRLWYMQQSIEQGWSRDVLTAMIKGKAHERQGQAVSAVQRWIELVLVSSPVFE